jgi:DNA polymerase-1
MTPHLLIDADLLLYKAAIGSEFSCNWGDDNWVLSANLQQAKDAITARIHGMQEHFETGAYTLVRSDRENFRKQLFPEYKGNREDVRKPIIFNQLVDWLDDAYSCIYYGQLEADDTLGILHTQDPNSDTIIVSEDKDMLTVPGKLYRGGELITVTPEMARYHHMCQTLTGDATDGYPGCPGVGPKTAEKLLQGAPEGFWGVVVQAYQKPGLTEDDALLNARMAYILQAENWNDGEIKLWQP